jgi:hypothetical protein
LITVKTEFENRVSEIEEYYKLLHYFFEKDAIVHFPNNKTHKFRELNTDLQRVLKANCFLLLYNLIESSIRLSITEIYDQITSRNLTYEEVSPLIKKIWLKEGLRNFKDKSESSIFEIITNLDNDSIVIDFDSSKIISGNIDRRKISLLSEIYGFSMKVHHTAGNGNKLHIVKVRRNALAHGNTSFSQCGREFTYTDLQNIKIEVIRYLRQILRNIEKYLDNEKFLK